MSRGAVAAILIVVLGLIVLGVVILLGRRSATARTIQASQPAANKWSVIGQALGLGTALVGSWKPGSGTASVGGKQVTGQTGDWLKQGVPSSQSGLGYTYDLGQGYGTTYSTASPGTIQSKDFVGGSGVGGTTGGLFDFGYSSEEERAAVEAAMRG